MSVSRYCKALGLKQTRAPNYVSEQAFIHEAATIGRRTFVCAGAWIGPDVRIGTDCYVGPNAVIGSPGFGYDQIGNDWYFREHPFGVFIDDRVSVGAGTVIDRGRHRDTYISGGTKIDAACFLAHNVKVGISSLIIANSMIAGSAEIGDYCWIGPSAQVSDHVKIGSRSRLGIGSVAIKNIPAGELWVGSPAHYLREHITVTSHSAVSV